MSQPKDPYADRPMVQMYPDLERLGAEYHAAHHVEHAFFTPAVLDCLPRLVGPVKAGTRALVIGCGPRPRAVLELAARGYEATGIEPVPLNVREARAFVGDKATIVEGSAERIPVPDGSVGLVLMESVLEHVDSPSQSLAEIHRALAPGGVVYVYTTNRLKFSWRGFNGEYSVPFLNWFPAGVREAYVFHQQHYAPELANYNARPAYHWFTYARLCQLGRFAGFAQFYSLLDLVDLSNPLVRGRPLRRWLLGVVRRRPWLRALALTQSGGSIFMVKRP